jgi:ParB-like chromosome segregation protein Spo0J
MPISKIKIGERHRKDLGDLDALASSIERGLLQPIGVSPELELIWGYRRLVAARDVLGRDEILCRVVSVASIVEGEFDENLLRKDFTPSERVAIVEALRGYGHGGDRKSDQSRNCDVDRLTTKQAAERVGFCRDDYFRAKKVVERGVPELVDAMDAGRLTIYSAAVLAEEDQDSQRAVLSRPIDEDRWAARGVQKRLRRVRRDRATAGRISVMTPGDQDSIRLYHCPFQRLEEVAGIGPGSVNLILTDIPYGKDFLPEVAELGEFASRVLVEGGLLVTYTGHLYLDEVMGQLGRHLTYCWTRASVWSGVGNIIHPRQVTSKWKPILVYAKGGWVERPRWYDVTQAESREKDWHDWQQPLEEVERLVRDFSQPGSVVVDPCGGGFTTAVACKKLGRRCISCDIDEAAVIRGQDRVAEAAPDRPSAD